jgi:uncharacterized protein YukE
MSAAIIQLRYEELERLASVLSQQAEETADLHSRLRAAMDNLEDGSRSRTRPRAKPSGTG